MPATKTVLEKIAAALKASGEFDNVEVIDGDLEGEIALNCDGDNFYLLIDTD